MFDDKNDGGGIEVVIEIEEEDSLRIGYSGFPEYVESSAGKSKHKPKKFLCPKPVRFIGLALLRGWDGLMPLSQQEKL